MDSNVFLYERNELLDAGQPYTNNGNGQHIKAKHRGNNYGGSVGGRVWIPKLYNGKDKTFFFFSYEKYGQNLQTTTYQTVPTVLMRAGNFSQALTGRNLGTDPLGASIMENTVYDPLTNQTVNGQVTRTPFPGNIIPTSRLDPVALKIQAWLPTPTNNLVLLNWLQSVPAPDSRNVPSIKIDQYFGVKSKLSFYYSRYRYATITGADGLPAPITVACASDIEAKTARLNYDYTVSPTLLIHAGFGYLRPHHYNGDIPAVYAYDPLAGLGLVGNYTNGMPHLTGLSSTTGGGYSPSQQLGTLNLSDNFNDKPTAVLNATLVRGNHTYKAGAQWRRDEAIVHSYASVPTWTFSANETALPYLQTTTIGGGSIGLPWASFLLGLGDSAKVPSLPAPFYRKSAWGFYLQDTWKITRKLTLDYGLRYDYQHAPEEVNYRDSMFGPTIPNPSAGGLLGGQVYEGYGPGRCNCQFTTPYPYAVGPRLGLAYQFAHKMVLRAGWGIVYGNTPDGGEGVGNGVGWNTLTWSSPSFGTPAATFSQGLVYNPASLFSVTLDPGMFPSPGQINSPAYYLDRNAGRPPRFNQWNIALQREITNNIVVEAAYVGNRGIWLQSNSYWDLNALTPQRIASFGLNVNNSADLTLLNSALNSSLAASRGFSKPPYAAFPMTLTVAQALRPYPQFGSLPESWAPLGNTWYDALQTKFSKRMSHGLGATGAFTWSKSLNIGANTNTGGGTINDQFNRQNNKEFATMDQPFVLVISFNYRIPRLGPNRLVRNVVGDWTFSGTEEYGSGALIATPTAQNNLSTILFRNTLFNRVPGVPLYLTNINGPIDPNKQFLLNPAAWSNPAAGQWGTAAPYYSDFRGRRLPNEQASLGRLFRMREGITLEFRVEYTNIFNRRVWGSASASNPMATQTYANGVPTSGFGYISANTAPPIANWRNGQALVRLQF
ncbi:MAG: TonB-dependent receptor [Roseiarcus sp.]